MSEIDVTPDDVLRIIFACGTEAKMPVRSAVSLLIRENIDREKVRELRRIVERLAGHPMTLSEREAFDILDSLMGDVS